MPNNCLSALLVKDIITLYKKLLFIMYTVIVLAISVLTFIEQIISIWIVI